MINKKDVKLVYSSNKRIATKKWLFSYTNGQTKIRL